MSEKTLTIKGLNACFYCFMFHQTRVPLHPLPWHVGKGNVSGMMCTSEVKVNTRLPGPGKVVYNTVKKIAYPPQLWLSCVRVCVRVCVCVCVCVQLHELLS